MPLITIPENAKQMREHLFELAEPVTLTRADFALYWPLIDTVWNKNGLEGKHVGYRCRLSRATKACKRPTTGGKTRNRTQRNIALCKCWMKRLNHPDGSVTLTRRTNHHSHKLIVSDKVKLNSFLINLITEEGSRNHKPPAVLAALRGRLPLDDIGGRFITPQTVPNLTIAWKLAHPEHPFVAAAAT